MPVDISGSADEDQTSNLTAEAVNNTRTNETTTKSTESTVRPNLLGDFASYTYQLSLYMLTPEAYSSWILNGRKNLQATSVASNNGIVLIAQSGGINNQTSVRAKGFELDYYIDNLKLITTASAKAQGLHANTTEIEFSITEPYGFSFIKNLKQAYKGLVSSSKVMSKGKQLNPTKGFFIIGLRFTGYDIEGNVVKASDLNTLASTTIGDTKVDTSGVLESLHEIFITEMTFKINGSITTYNIKAAPVSGYIGYSQKLGVVTSNKEFTKVSTVEETLQELINSLNKDQQTLLNNKSDKTSTITEVNNYSIEFNNDPNDEIRKAKLVNPADVDKWKFGGSGATSSSAVTEDKANTPPSTQFTTIAIPAGESILTAINNIITRSTFLVDSLKKIYYSDPNSPSNTNKSEDNPDNNKNISWYNVTTQVTNPRWDNAISDWAYDIKFIISKYDCPMMLTTSGVNKKSYPGPKKRYQYWYTGKNSEIIDYSQQYNALYYKVFLDGIAKENVSAVTANGLLSLSGLKPANQNKQGKIAPGSQTQNEVTNELTDPSALATASIKIMGDPDFLIHADAPPGELYNKYYNNTKTINPNGGMVFIEIDFKEPVDYNNNTGLLNINNNILFWEYPKSFKIQGICYQVITVISEFREGKFRQTLNTVLAIWPLDEEDGTLNANRETASDPLSNARDNTTSSTGPNSTGNSGKNSGLKYDDAPDVTSYDYLVQGGAITQEQANSLEGVTADDDQSFSTSYDYLVQGGAITSEDARNLG